MAPILPQMFEEAKPKAKKKKVEKVLTLTKKTVWRVQCWEYERGWGKNDMGHRDFPSYKKALAYQAEYNKDNTLDYVPDCYYTAEDPKGVEIQVEVYRKAKENGKTKTTSSGL